MGEAARGGSGRESSFGSYHPGEFFRESLVESGGEVPAHPVARSWQTPAAGSRVDHPSACP